MRFFVCFVVLVMMALPAAAQEEAPSDSLIHASAEAWLTLVDSAQYAASWEQAADVFRQNISAAQWAQAAAQARSPFGMLQARNLNGLRQEASLPNAPPGNYVILEYTSAFTLIPRAVETLVLSETPEGEWRAGGYFIRPVQ